MSKRIFAVSSSFIALALAAACGGGGGEPETPTTEASAEPTEEAATEAPPAQPEAAPEPVEEAPKLGPKDILLKEGTLFLVDFTKSDIGIKIDEKCAKKSGEDVAKKANCVSKEMDKLPREGITFDEDDAGKWFYIRFGIERNNVQVIYNKMEVTVGEPSGSKLTLTPVGKDLAKRKKGTVPKELNFEVPDEYTIVLLDPDRGRMEFEPKLGLLEEGQPQQ